MKYRKDLYVILFILLLVVIFFFEILLTEKNFIHPNFFHYHYPNNYFATECIKLGIIPFWNPYFFCGIPFLANLKSAIFYPLSFIKYFFPFYFGFKLFIVAHFFLAALFMYLLMRSWLKEIPALISAISYGFSGYLFSLIDLTFTLTTSIWTPLSFLILNRVIEKKSSIILLGLVLGIQFLAGAPDIFLITLLGLILFSLVKNMRRGIWIFILAGMIGIGASLFQILPFLEMCSFSTRVNIGIEYFDATVKSLTPVELLALFIPIKSCYYLGIIPFCLIVVGIFYSKRRLTMFWTCILVGSILLSLGKYFPLYPILYKYIPIFSWIRYPRKFFSLTIFSGAILAGFGANKLIYENKGLNFLRVITLICFIAWLLTWICKDFILSLFADFNYIFTMFLSFIFLSLATLLLILRKLKYIRIWIFSISIISIIIVELFISGSKINLVGDKMFYDYKPEIVRLIECEAKKDKDYFRILSAYDIKVNGSTLPMLIERLKSALLPNIGIIYHLFEAYGYDGFRLKDYDTYLSFAFIELEKVSPLLHLLNIKYIITPDKLTDMDIFYDGGEFKVYKNDKYLPRAFFVPKARIIKDREEILNILASGEFDPKNEVIIEEKIRNSEFEIRNKSQIPNPKSQIQIVDYQLNKVVINTSCDNNGFLFISDTYYPGWQAYLDGKLTKVYRANFLFRAIVLPQGNHQVEFVFSPLSFKIGLLGTLITIIILIIVAISRCSRFRVQSSRLKTEVFEGDELSQTRFCIF